MQQNVLPRDLTGTRLKWIAIVTMFLDHVGATLALSYYTQAPDEFRYELMGSLRVVGRMAFPIFCFLLAEGLFYTRSKWKYAARLGLFALIAEIPFDIAFNRPGNGMLEFGSQNVFFTLFLGLIALWLWQALAERLPKGLAYPAVLPGAVLCYLAAEWLSTDYSGFGVALILALGIGRGLEQEPSRQRRFWQAAFGALTVLFYCWSRNNWIEIFALIGLICTLRYNGQRGRGNKWFFYVFYPAHLLVLGLLNRALF